MAMNNETRYVVFCVRQRERERERERERHGQMPCSLPNRERLGCNVHDSHKTQYPETSSSNRTDHLII